MVLSQHSLKGIQTYDGDAIGLSQGGAFGEDPNLRRQVQNCAAHDTVGYVLSHMHDTSRPSNREVSVFPNWSSFLFFQELVCSPDRYSKLRAGGAFCHLVKKTLYQDW